MRMSGINAINGLSSPKALHSLDPEICSLAPIRLVNYMKFLDHRISDSILR
jgi:hypothetical protein